MNIVNKLWSEFFLEFRFFILGNKVQEDGSIIDSDQKVNVIILIHDIIYSYLHNLTIP